MKTRLGDLRHLKASETVVAYIAAYAMVDGTGDVQILAYDSDPFAPKTLLPLRTVLAELRACHAQHKLLILDIMCTSDYPLDLGGTPDGVADLIRRELQSEKDPGRPSTRPCWSWCLFSGSSRPLVGGSRRVGVRPLLP